MSEVSEFGRRDQDTTAAGRSAVMPQDFEVRNRETRDQIHTVIWREQAPSPYRSFAEYQRTLALAYQARERFYEDVIEHAIHHGPDGVLFAALLDAQSGCHNAAVAAQREARRAAREDQERAFASYADNIAVALDTRRAVAA